VDRIGTLLKEFQYSLKPTLAGGYFQGRTGYEPKRAQTRDVGQIQVLNALSYGMFRNTEYGSALFCSLACIFQGDTLSVRPCSPPRPALGQHSLNALRLSRRDSKSMGGLYETWEGCFNCDLTAHLDMTLDC
jgi:hypothetical protein